jgi:16S rRNA (guanine1207-N2)-methyltransferase
MSGPAPPLADGRDPALDEGVLDPGPLLEFNGYSAVRRQGGSAVLPWRAQHRQALACGVVSVADGAQIIAGSHRQALVRLQKGRAATYSDLCAAWRALAPSGRLLVAGGNELGVSSWCRRLAQEGGEPLAVLANHSHARVAAMRRPDLLPAAWVAATGSAPGLFHGGDLDPGSAALIAHLAELPPPRLVLDLGCGAGHLGLAALARWPQSRCWFLDADARAVAAVQAALAGNGGELHARAAVAWWDVAEALPAPAFDAVLCNPPAHAGTLTDLTTARAMFRLAAAALAPGGRLLVVANRKLPYEADLARLGSLSCLAQEGGFKVLALAGAGGPGAGARGGDGGGGGLPRAPRR